MIVMRVKSTSDGRLLHRPKARVTLPPAVDETETLQKLYRLLEAKGFETRMEGVALLLDLCKNSPKLIANNIVQIFDYFALRISDTHKRVKQMALSVLAEMIVILEDAMNPVIVRLVEGITRNLNSKDPGVHATAVNALEESIDYLDLTDYSVSTSLDRPTDIYSQCPCLPSRRALSSTLRKNLPTA
ncbi:hypothetical protein TURU_090090 [Turdus rufiventris]|nr:hypothetical protein TURU_090090 [Turdus rufiventris]